MIEIDRKIPEVEAAAKKAGAEFFGNSSKRTREWWILGRAVGILRLTKGGGFFHACEMEAPCPDFQLHSRDLRSSVFIEITESIELGRRRHDEVKKRLSGELPSIWSTGIIADPYIAFREVIAKKLQKAKTYPAGTWLLVYFSIGRLSMPGNLGISWEQLIFDEVESWRERGLVREIECCRFDRILVIDSEGKRLVCIFPNFSVLHKPDDS